MERVCDADDVNDTNDDNDDDKTSTSFLYFFVVKNVQLHLVGLNCPKPHIGAIYLSNTNFTTI